MGLFRVGESLVGGDDLLGAPLGPDVEVPGAPQVGTGTRVLDFDLTTVLVLEFDE